MQVLTSRVEEWFRESTAGAIIGLSIVSLLYVGGFYAMWAWLPLEVLWFTLGVCTMSLVVGYLDKAQGRKSVGPVCFIVGFLLLGVAVAPIALVVMTVVAALVYVFRLFI